MRYRNRVRTTLTCRHPNPLTTFQASIRLPTREQIAQHTTVYIKAILLRITAARAPNSSASVELSSLKLLPEIPTVPANHPCRGSVLILHKHQEDIFRMLVRRKAASHPSHQQPFISSNPSLCLKYFINHGTPVIHISLSSLPPRPRFSVIAPCIAHYSLSPSRRHIRSRPPPSVSAAAAQSRVLPVD